MRIDKVGVNQDPLNSVNFFKFNKINVWLLVRSFFLQPQKTSNEKFSKNLKYPNWIFKYCAPFTRVINA